MNTAPKLPLTVRLGTAVVAFFATCAILTSVDALSAHYVKQGAAHTLAAESTQHKTQHA